MDSHGVARVNGHARASSTAGAGDARSNALTPRRYGRVIGGGDNKGVVVSRRERRRAPDTDLEGGWQACNGTLRVGGPPMSFIKWCQNRDRLGN